MSTFAPGAVLRSRYELHHLLEDDGVTETWAATDKVLARPVMVHAVPAEQSREAFTAAATAAARLVHPGVATTYDSGEIDSIPYVVTERPSGVTLAESVERHGPIATGRVVLIGRQIARALEAAHRAGVVHGGVDMTTIVVGEEDVARLTRFAARGARARLRAGGSGSAAGDVNDLARTLTTAAASPLPLELQHVLRGAQPGGAITTAGALATALDGVQVPDEIPVGDRTPPRGDRTPPMGTPQVPASIGSRNMRGAGIVIGVLLVVGIAITGFLLTQSGGGSHSPGAGSPAAGDLTAAAVHSFNPEGSPDKSENENLVANLTDDDPSTVWSTFEYKTERFGNLKTGTGVVLTLSSRQTLHQLTITSQSRGWAFNVYVADQPADALTGWGTPLATVSAVMNDVTQVDLNGVKGGAVLVWITDLGTPAANAASFPYRVDIGELDLR